MGSFCVSSLVTSSWVNSKKTNTLTLREIRVEWRGVAWRGGSSYKRDDKENIVNLFDWDNGEVKELEKLTAASESRNTLVHKKYRHIVYLSELLYAVSIDLKENISSNPGCEWQLKYFGK
jgi:hypothetical protein